MSTTTITQFHTAISTAIATHFGANVNTVAWYEQGEETNGQPKAIKTPAIILDIESADEGEDGGDDRTPLLCHITAYCILGRATPSLEIAVRDFASQLFAKLRKNKWGLGHNVSFPSSITLGPGKFDPEKNGYESWFVSWDQTVFLGTDVWLGTGSVPTDIYLGFSPEIGFGYEDKYDVVTELPPV